jgi:hypothetical protein
MILNRTSENVIKKVKLDTNKTLTKKNNILYEGEIDKKCKLSENIIGNKEYLFFISYFNLNSNKEVLKKIYSIQNHN